MRIPRFLNASALALALALGAPAAQAQQGVSKGEIVLGSIQDLSGPAAGLGKPARNGLLLRVEEINEQGGINGRKLKLLVEDDGYDPKKAVLAAHKLVNQDKIFIMLAHLGTAANNAAMPVQFEKNVVNFMPLTAAREMYEPLNRLKYAMVTPYYDQVRIFLPRLVQQKKPNKVCIIYQDDEFGLEVLRGAEDGLKPINVALAEKTSFKRGATDFSSQVSKMKAAECDFVVMGTIIRETIGTIATARKLGYNPTFFASQAAYTEVIHKLGGPAMNGLYAAMATQLPYLDDASQPIRFWANKYKTRFNEDPSVFALYGYIIVDLFARAATQAGANLNTDTFVKVMDAMVVPPDVFGTPELRYTPQSHLGTVATRLSQIQDGRWKVVSEYVAK